jgi:hypothetical protein
MVEAVLILEVLRVVTALDKAERSRVTSAHAGPPEHERTCLSQLHIDGSAKLIIQDDVFFLVASHMQTQPPGLFTKVDR